MLIAKFPDMFAQTELNWYHYCLPSMHRWFFVDIDGKQRECWITLSWVSYFCILKTHFDINSSTQQTSLSRDLCVYAVSVYVCVCVCVCVCACDKLHLCVNAVDRVADILSGRHYHWEGQQDHRGDAPEFVFLIRNTNICCCTMDQIAMEWKAYQCSRNTLESMWMCETWKICNY